MSTGQVLPEFVVTQGEKSLSVLEEIKTFFGCGRVFINRRYDNHNENLYRFCVRTIKDLREMYKNNITQLRKMKWWVK